MFIQKKIMILFMFKKIYSIYLSKGSNHFNKQLKINQNNGENKIKATIVS